MRQSNIYIILYSAAITIVSGGLLAFASISLKPAQDANIALEQKKNILSSVITLDEHADITKMYSQKVKAFVLDFDGNVKPDMKAEQVVVAVEYKKAPKDRLLPVYEFMSDADSTKVEFAVMPVYGYGLWNNIWGFVAVQHDFNTIQGVKFQHAGETPGLGARIETEEIQARFKGKTIFTDGKLMSVTIQKGEGNDYSGDAHKVDGMSGATLTGKGVNNMLKDYFACYENYLKKHSAVNQ
ncbi:MAG: NADH:ubiquinone reductase (Na(+)-transporting) subunit C [Bacteroidetes bacterium]|nr:NADH:ubiquinone reductase (Na(+)-transporting) subunit C [Bacteroidota bacterium]MBS1978663.1 NADH:ubiquinone reductase (Na(+)-transporting) subunit C [Bacteroidota bacterium]